MRRTKKAGRRTSCRTKRQKAEAQTNSRHKRGRQAGGGCPHCQLRHPHLPARTRMHAQAPISSAGVFLMCMCVCVCACVRVCVCVCVCMRSCLHVGMQERIGLTQICAHMFIA